MPYTCTISRLINKLNTFFVGSDSGIWWKAVGNKHRILANVIYNRSSVTYTIVFIRNVELPRVFTVTYENFVCGYLPLKSEPFRVRLTVGGERLEYP